MAYCPPYHVTPETAVLVEQVQRLIRRLEGTQLIAGDLRLRRKNRIESLHSSLVIEGNKLTLEQVTDIINGKPVVGSPKDILEVQNAVDVYETLPSLDARSEINLLSCHGTLMRGLIADAGRYRSSGVGVFDGDQVVHLAPPAARVPALMGQLFEYLNEYKESLLIKSCVFHYEFEFIHPFSDGNGRMGRLWHTAILKEVYQDFIAIPLEGMILDRQQACYNALQQSQRIGHSTPFLLYAMTAIHDVLVQQLQQVTSAPNDPVYRLEAFRRIIGDKMFSRKEYIIFHKTISEATATRDLRQGVMQKLLVRSGSLRTTRYQFIPRQETLRD